MSTDEEELGAISQAGMDLLGTMSSRMGAYEKRLEEMTTCRAVTAQAVFTAPSEPSTSRVLNGGGTQRCLTAAAPDSFPDVAEVVRVIVAKRLRGAPALPVHPDEDSVSKDELEVPTRRKGALKSC